eukprot:133703-Prymnesium_polylepis.1
MQDAQPTPSQADALREAITPTKRSDAVDKAAEEDSSLEYGFLVVVIAITAAAMSSAEYAALMPDVAIWCEVLFSFAAGCAINALLALAIWSTCVTRVTTTLCVGGMVLCVPYGMPFEYGISASALAIICFIGVWKALDVAGGTRPPQVVSNGLGAFATHMAVPVEYRIDGEGVATADRGLWLQMLLKALSDLAGLGLSATLRSRFASPRPLVPQWPSCNGALGLYAEVWTVLLFLRLFCDSFATLLALGGYRPQTTFRSPLLRSTSLSDFWSRRWNLLIHGLFRRTVFEPLARRHLPPWAAGLVAFALSGVFHEYSFALAQPALHKSLGRCFLFFVAQAPVVSAEKLAARRLRVPWPMSHSSVACTLAWTISLVPLAPLFMHPLKTSGVFDQIDMLVPRLVFE